MAWTAYTTEFDGAQEGDITMNNYKIGYYYDGSEAFVKDNGSNPHIFAVGCS